jgi:hypothetical protein
MNWGWCKGGVRKRRLDWLWRMRKRKESNTPSHLARTLGQGNLKVEWAPTMGSWKQDCIHSSTNRANHSSGGGRCSSHCHRCMMKMAPPRVGLDAVIYSGSPGGCRQSSACNRTPPKGALPASPLEKGL